MRALRADAYTPARYNKRCDGVQGRLISPATLTITATLVSNSKGDPDGYLRVQVTAKSGNGDRVVALPDWVSGMIAERVERARETEKRLLCTTSVGTPVSAANFRTRLRMNLEAAGLGDAPDAEPATTEESRTARGSSPRASDEPF